MLSPAARVWITLTSSILLTKKKIFTCLQNYMYLLTEWEGRTGKYLPRGHGVRTECEVLAPWPSAKYFPIRTDLTQSISILLYDHRAFPFFFSLAGRANQIWNVPLRRSFWPKSRDLYSNKVVIVRSSCALLIKSPCEGCTRSLAGSDGFFRHCSRHRVRPSYGDFLNSFAMKARAGPYRSYDKYHSSTSLLGRHVVFDAFMWTGITCPRAGRIVTSQGVIATQGEPFGDEALAFTKDLCMQKEVRGPNTWHFPPGTWDCFSKVPKFFVPLSGATIPLYLRDPEVSNQWNSAILLDFLPLKTC